MSTSTPSSSRFVASISTTPHCVRRSKRPATRPRRTRAMATATKSDATTEVRLDLEGMTCASCAARIEKRLNKLDGVEATVNFATEQATVHCDADLPVEQLVTAVESAGYGARPVGAAHDEHGRES